MAKIFSIISITSLCIAVFLLIIAIIMFFRFRVLKIFGELSGRTAKKAISKNRNEVISNNKASLTKKSKKKTAKSNQSVEATLLLEEGEATEILYEDNGTEVLIDSDVNGSNGCDVTEIL